MGRRWRVIALVAITLGGGGTLFSPDVAAESMGGVSSGESNDTPTAQLGTSSGHPPIAESESHPVQVNDEEVFLLSLPRDGKTAAERAAAASRALEEAFRESGARVKVTVAEKSAIVYVAGRAILQLGEEDSRAAGRASLKAYADEIEVSLRMVARREDQRRAIAQRVLSISSIVFLAVLAWIMLGMTGQVAERAHAWISRDTTKVRALRLKKVEILPASAVREALRLSVFGGLWLVRLGLVYTCLLAVLSLFPSTRPLAGRATGFLFAPAIDLLARLATRLPIFLALALAALLVLLIVRFISLYARGIEQGEIKSKWVRPETARTTGRLLVLGVCLGSLLFVTPLLSGTTEGSLPRLGLLGFAAIALGATPILTSCLLGVRMVYGQVWQLGDIAEYGGEKGRVESLGLFDVRLRREDGALVRVPHLMSLWNPTRIFSLSERLDLKEPRSSRSGEEERGRSLGASSGSEEEDGG